MTQKSAAAALREAALSALEAVDGLAAYPGPPLQAVVPYAVVEAGPETDWSHKNGQGREVRLALTLSDRGERDDRLRRLMEEAETAIGTLVAPSGWQLVTFRFLRSRVAQPRTGSTDGPWTGLIEFRARMLREA